MRGAVRNLRAEPAAAGDGVEWVRNYPGQLTLNTSPCGADGRSASCPPIFPGVEHKRENWTAGLNRQGNPEGNREPAPPGAPYTREQHRWQVCDARPKDPTLGHAKLRDLNCFRLQFNALGCGSASLL
jgi:hypothetical protein